MVEYNPIVIRRYANMLYNRASGIIFTWTVLGLIPGFFAGLLIAKSFQSDFEIAGVCIGLLIGGIGGYIIGSDRAFALKLRAQLALCQVQIEYNTRIQSKAHALQE